MNEIRKVIGTFDEPVLTKDGNSFPVVRAWVRGLNAYETKDLWPKFPTRGTVFLRAAVLDGSRPEKHETGLFYCVEALGQSAAWKVDSVGESLARVIEWSGWDTDPNPVAFSLWIATHREQNPLNIFLGTGAVYVTRGKGELVGPFNLSLDGKLTPRGQTSLYEGVEPIRFEVGGKRRTFIDSELLPKGKALVVDIRDAFHRQLKLASATGQVSWLSRDRTRDLANALSAAATDEGSEWVAQELSRVLAAFSLTGGIDGKLAKALLDFPSVAKSIEEFWKQNNSQEVKNAEAALQSLRNDATKARQTTSSLQIEAQTQQAQINALKEEEKSLRNTLAAQQKQIDDAKKAATAAFQAELKRLADSPESMALLGAWMGAPRNKTPERSLPLISVQGQETKSADAADFKSAIFNNLKACALSPQVATEITAVVRAALAAGQPIAFRSLFADILTRATASALGTSAIVWADVPAGLLDPIAWEELIPSEHQGSPLVLQNINRSDISLVLGSLRRTLLDEVLGSRAPQSIIFMTLEPKADMRVAPDYPLGPLIDERVLRFTPSKLLSGVNAFPDFRKQLPQVPTMTAEEFMEIGDALRRLPFLAVSAQEIVFRRAYAALNACCDTSGEARRLFFKYWCLPRCDQDDLLTVLDANKDAWAQDKSLLEIRETLNNNA